MSVHIDMYSPQCAQEASVSVHIDMYSPQCEQEADQTAIHLELIVETYRDL